MTEDNKEIVQVDSLNSKLDTLVTDIMQEDDPNKTKDLVNVFNWNISKKNIARIHTLNNLYDSITAQMVERVEKRADQFSNSDLLDYVKTIQTAIDTNTKNLSQVKEPPVILHQNNTQINVNLADSFDRQTRERILSAVQATLKQAQRSDKETYTIETDNSLIEN